MRRRRSLPSARSSPWPRTTTARASIPGPSSRRLSSLSFPLCSPMALLTTIAARSDSATPTSPRSTAALALARSPRPSSVSRCSAPIDVEITCRRELCLWMQRYRHGHWRSVSCRGASACRRVSRTEEEVPWPVGMIATVYSLSLICHTQHDRGASHCLILRHRGRSRL